MKLSNVFWFIGFVACAAGIATEAVEKMQERKANKTWHKATLNSNTPQPERDPATHPYPRPTDTHA